MPTCPDCGYEFWSQALFEHHRASAHQGGCGCLGAEGPCNACRIHGHASCGLHSNLGGKA